MRDELPSHTPPTPITLLEWGVGGINKCMYIITLIKKWRGQCIQWDVYSAKHHHEFVNDLIYVNISILLYLNIGLIMFLVSTNMILFSFSLCKKNCL